IDDKYNVNCEYNDQLYSDEYIDILLNSIRIVVEKFLTLDNNTQLKEISITEEDNWTPTDLEYIDIGEKRVNKIFESCVEENGDDVAVYACDGRYTFNQLNTKANRIANALIKKGVNIEDKVMIILKRNSNFIASMFGILKAGAAFIPIDSDYPKDRIEHVLRDSDSKYIITDEIIEIKNLDLSEYNNYLLNINDLLEEENTKNPETNVTESNLAYLIYTSGSTGLPKGVMLEHQNLANFTYPHPDNVYTYELATNYKKEDYRVLSTITVAFDVFLEETMCSLLNGVPIVLADDNTYKDPKATMELVEKYKANVYTATPSRILQYLQIKQIRNDMLKFKVYAIAGEPFPNRLYEDLSANTDAHIFNVYGPTETTISCNTALLSDNNITVGKELFNVKEQIMDLDSNPLPTNVIGELYIAGLGVSRAYHNRPENNAKSYTTINDIRYYKSGDLAKRGLDGQIYVYGRLDNQIKLRGLRIEIGEIESAISKCEEIKDVAVVVRNINDNDYLCAYYTVYEEYKKDDEYSIDIDKLREKLEDSLVYYMIPTFFTELDKFPRTPNDKVDLKNLPEPQTDIDNYKNPSNEIEEKLWAIISEILNISSFGVDTDLFTIGLTSLTMMQVVSEIYEEFKTQLMITQVMKSKTIEKISMLIKEDKIEEYDTQNMYPLTPNQLGVYFECVKKPEDLSYNMPIKIEFGSEIDPHKLKSAIITAINNHPYLKTRIIMNDGEVYQERRDNLAIDEFVEITDDPADEDNFVKTFVLDKGPLFRFKICENTTLLADFHHIIMDGTSLNIFFDEIAKIYDDKDYTIEEIDGFEYSLNEAKIEKSNLYKEAELFFFDKIKEFEEATLISPDLNGQKENGVSLEKTSYLKKDDINRFCDEHNINPNNLFMAVTSFVLSKFVYNKNVLIATLSNGRYTKAQEKTLAMMVKTLPLALKLNTELSISDYLSYINEEWLNVLTYSSYPLTKISSDYDITPEFLYTYQGMINE
ncbi:MAG: amino acid adenylation domain-containing protein, partial [Methanosphaera sp.]|nr:amino acid adenylation domain-containing protein [Methanosphaera sp.]